MIEQPSGIVSSSLETHSSYCNGNCQKSQWVKVVVRLKRGLLDRLSKAALTVRVSGSGG